METNLRRDSSQLYSSNAAKNIRFARGIEFRFSEESRAEPLKLGMVEKSMVPKGGLADRL